MLSRSLVLFVLLCAVCSSATFAQAAQRADIPAGVYARFVSIDGGFTIDLPSNLDEGVRPIGDLSSGAGTFTWRRPEGNFTIGFVDGIGRRPDVLSALNELADTVVANQNRSQAKLAERIEFSFYGSLGIELRLKRPHSHVIHRFILVKDRLYILTAEWSDGKDEAAPTRILDSFELVDGKALVA